MAGHRLKNPIFMLPQWITNLYNCYVWSLQFLIKILFNSFKKVQYDLRQYIYKLNVLHA